MCFRNPQHDGFADLVLGSCRKDADLTRKGFHDCGGGLDNYDSCAAGVQINDVRAAGMARPSVRQFLDKQEGPRPSSKLENAECERGEDAAKAAYRVMGLYGPKRKVLA